MASLKPKGLDVLILGVEWGLKKRGTEMKTKVRGWFSVRPFFFYPNYFLVAALDSCFFFFG